MLWSIFSMKPGFGTIGALTSGSFPKPLSESEEALYLKKMKDGDEDAKNILIEHNLRLVAHIVKKYADSSDSDDLISIGTIGLIKGISSFDKVRTRALQLCRALH